MENEMNVQQKAARPHRPAVSRSALKYILGMLIFALVILVVLSSAMRPLNAWLERFESQQSVHTAHELYQLLFANPDWAMIYDLAGVDATEFEGRAEYVEYMQAKVGNAELDYAEIPAGLSGEQRYSVRLGDEQIAAFTIVPQHTDSGDFAGWGLGQVDVYFTREESVTVNIMPGCTVYINGIPLDESYTTVRVSTPAEAYLPEGVHGFRYEQVHISGLLCAPDIAVLDEHNMPLPLTQDPETLIYSVPIANTEPITAEEHDLVLAAAQADALFSIRAISMSQLRQHFNTGSAIYAQISGADPVLSGVESYAFDESATNISGYYRYTQNLFSVRVQLKLDVTKADGTSTSLLTDYTYFFTVNNADHFLVTDRLEMDLQELITETVNP